MPPHDPCRAAGRAGETLRLLNGEAPARLRNLRLFRLDANLFRAEQAKAGILPQAILTRRKKGFSSPVLDWQKPQTRNGTRLGGSALWAAQVYDTWQTLHGLLT